jgi:hypothetical protein
MNVKQIAAVGVMTAALVGGGATAAFAATGTSTACPTATTTCGRCGPTAAPPATPA